MVGSERTCNVNEKVPQHTPIHFLLVSSKILVFEDPFEMRQRNPTTKSPRDAVIQHVGVLK